MDSHTRPGTSRLTNDCNGSGGNRQPAHDGTSQGILILPGTSPHLLRRPNNLVHLQLLSGCSPIQRLRERPRRKVAKHFFEDDFFFIDLIILHQHQPWPFPARNILKANTASRIRTVAPNRTVARRRPISPEHSESRHLRAAPLRPILLDDGEPSRPRAPNNLSLARRAVRRTRVRSKLFLD